jgi:hypothetical protein
MRQAWTPLLDCLMRLHKLQLVDRRIFFDDSVRAHMVWYISQDAAQVFLGYFVPVRTLSEFATDAADALQQGCTPLLDCLMRLHKLQLVDRRIFVNGSVRTSVAVCPQEHVGSFCHLVLLLHHCKGAL